MFVCLRADPHADDMRAFAAQVPVVTFAMYNKDADVWPDKVVVQTPVGALQVGTRAGRCIITCTLLHVADLAAILARRSSHGFSPPRIFPRE